MHTELHAGFRVYKEGTLVFSTVWFVCGYFKLKLSIFIFETVCCIFIAHCLLWSNIHHSKISIPIRTCVRVFRIIKKSHCCSRWS